MGAPLYDYASRFPRTVKQPDSQIAGIALFTEGVDTNFFGLRSLYGDELACGTGRSAFLDERIRGTPL